MEQQELKRLRTNAIGLFVKQQRFCFHNWDFVQQLSMLYREYHFTQSLAQEPRPPIFFYVLNDLGLLDKNAANEATFLVPAPSTRNLQLLLHYGIDFLREMIRESVPFALINKSFTLFNFIDYTQNQYLVQLICEEAFVYIYSETSGRLREILLLQLLRFNFPHFSQLFPIQRVTRNRTTLLMIAAALNQSIQLQKLIDQEPRLLYQRDKNGYSALIIAVISGSAECVDFLLAFEGGMVDNENNTALKLLIQQNEAIRQQIGAEKFHRIIQSLSSSNLETEALSQYDKQVMDKLLF